MMTIVYFKGILKFLRYIVLIFYIQGIPKIQASLPLSCLQQLNEIFLLHRELI